MADSFPAIDENADYRLSSTGRAGSGLSGFIFDIKRYAIHDGPGIRTTVFFKGCPLRCGWCHNPESWTVRPEPGFRPGRCAGCGRCVEVCKAGAITLSEARPVTDGGKCVVCGECVDECPAGAREILGRKVSVEEVMAEIERDIIFYDESGGGATFSGGEPLMQPDFLLTLLDRCRTLGIRTAVDSSCFCEPRILDEVAARADMFLCDIKHMDSSLHERFTGVGNGLILDNITRLAKKDRGIVIRIPVIGGFNDDWANITATAAFAAGLSTVDRIDILPYNSGGKEKSARLAGRTDVMEATAPSGAELDSIAQLVRTYGFRVRIGG